MLDQFLSNTPAVLLTAVVATVAVAVSIVREWRLNHRDDRQDHWPPP